MKISLLIAAALLALTTAAGAAERPPLIPVEDFFRLPDKARFTISPDGLHYAWMAPWKGRMNVYVASVDALCTGEGTRVTSATERDIAGYGWVSNDRLVYMQDKGGDENHHIYSVARDGSDVRDMTPFDGVKSGIVDQLD